MTYNNSQSTESRLTSAEYDDEINLLEILTVLKRRWIWLGLTFTAVLGSVVVGTLLQTPIYQAGGRLLIKSDTTASELLGLAEQFGALDAASNQSNPIETEIQVLLSPPLLEQVINQLNLKDAEGLPLELEDFTEQFSASAVRGTDVIDLKYKDPDPKLASEVINTLMRIYLKNNVDVNRSQTIAAREFISRQLPRSERKLKEAQLALKQFKQDNEIVEPQEEASAALTGLSELQTNIIATRAELLEAQKRTDQLRSKLGGISAEEAIASSNIAGSQRLQSNIQAVEQIRDELTRAEKIYANDHPALQELREKKAAMERSLANRLEGSTETSALTSSQDLEQSVGSEVMADLVRAENQAEGLQQRLAELNRSYNNESAKTSVFPALEQKITELKLNLEIATLNYTNLYEALQKALIAENQNIGNARILHQAAIPKDPISPRLLLNLLMGGVLGTLLGVGVCLLVDAKDLRLRSLEEIQKIYPYTLLGAIPEFSDLLDTKDGNRAQNLFVRDQPRSMISETYRMINTNLKFSRSDNLKVMVFSSGMPGEGKSSTIANIALAMAELGSRVLLIDSDMRLPSQHQVWELPNRKGLSHVLVDTDEHFQHLPIIPENDHLDILLAGALPPNPTALLDSKRFQEFIRTLRTRYDYVLIDAPPLTVASDALLISKVVDGLIIVARPITLNKAAANVVANTIRQAGVNVLGMIGNGIHPKNETKNMMYYQQEYYGKASLENEKEIAKEQAFPRSVFLSGKK